MPFVSKANRRGPLKSAPVWSPIYLTYRDVLCGRSRESASIATQDGVETQSAEIVAARLFVRYHAAARVAPANLPYAADHRMASLAVAEEVVDELADGGAARFGREPSPACNRHYGMEQFSEAVEARECVAVGLHPQMAIELFMRERDVL